MMEVPDVSYARSGDVAIAYQVVGEGPEDLVLLPFLANIWSLWTLPSFAKFGHKLALGRRLIVGPLRVEPARHFLELTTLAPALALGAHPLERRLALLFAPDSPGVRSEEKEA